MQKSQYKIKELDCPSELNLIKTKLGTKAYGLEADFEKRELWVYHQAEAQEISQIIDELKLGSKCLQSIEAEAPPSGKNQERKALWWVLILNFSFFLIEVGAGIWSGSMGLAADGLDMLADALVYGISLWAINESFKQQARVAQIAGYLQITLALLGFAEVLRRFFKPPETPQFDTMIWVSLAALAANALSLYLLRQSGSQKTAMKASMIFTSNDILINIGVILSAVGVYYLESAWPDLVIGSLVFLVVMWGARRILALAK